MRKIVSLLIIGLFVASCGVKNNVKGVSTQITGIDSGLDKDKEQRIIVVDQALSILPSDPESPPLVYTSNLLDFYHTHTVLAPRVSQFDGRRLRATSSYKLGNLLYVSYMMEGPEYLGALDIIDISSLSAPVVKSTYRFSNVKITDVKVHNGVAFLSGAKRSQGATMLALNVQNPVVPSLIKYTVFPGDIGTSVDVRQGKVIVSSATEGGLAVFNIEPQNYTFEKFNFVENALYVEYRLKNNDDSSDVEPMVMGGVGSTSILYEGHELPISSATSTAPSRFAIMGPMLYAVSDAGLTVSEISDKFNGFVRQIPITDGKPSGVAHLDQRLYVANGDAGLKYFNVDQPGNPQLIGFFDFEQDGGSANNVWVEKLNAVENLIIVADGKSGIRLIKEEKIKNSDKVVVQVLAKSFADAGENGKLAIFHNGTQVGSEIDVSSSSFELYEVSSQAPLMFGDEVKVVFFNDNGPRKVSVAYVKIGEDYFYPWFNNYFSMLNNRVYLNDSDNLLMNDGGYYKFIF